MDLFDIIDGIGSGKTVPSHHECKEVIELFESSESEVLDYHGFKFRNVGNEVSGKGKGTGEVLYSGNSIIIQWEKSDCIEVVRPTNELGIIVSDAVIEGSLVFIAALKESTITGNIDVFNNVLGIGGHVTVNGSIFTHKDSLCIENIPREQCYLEVADKSGMTKVTQPLIGPQTYDNMSYGRWTPTSPHLQLMVIKVKGVDVTLCSNADFTVGAYGYEKVPTIMEFDGGRLDCPEKKGFRHLVERPEAPEGSTKIEGYCKYVISDKEDGSDIELSEEAAELVSAIRIIRPDVADEVTVFTPVRNLRSIKKLLELEPQINVELLLQKRAFTNVASAECCCILGVPAEDYRTTEIMWMETKCTFLLKKAGYSEQEIKDIRGFSIPLAKYARQRFGEDPTKLTPFQVRYIYEMIPEYEFYFSGKTKEECAAEFLRIV